MIKEDKFNRLNHINKKYLVFNKNLSNDDLNVLSGKTLNVLFYICQHLDNMGNYSSDISNIFVAKMANVKDKTVSIYIKKLVDGEFLIKNYKHNHYYFLNKTKVKVR